MTVNFSTHGHYAITAAACLVTCVSPMRPWIGARNIIANASCTLLAALAFEGFRKLGAAFIHSPTALGTVGRGAVHIVGGTIALAAINEMVIYLHKKL